MKVSITDNKHAHQALQVEQSSKTKQLDEIKEMHKASKAKQFAQLMSEVQAYLGTKSMESSFEREYQEFRDFLSEIGYEGEPIASLSQEEAAELVSEDGFFGVKQTSERIAEFVIQGAGGDEKLLREGRKGIIQGFKEAEQMWGGKLPDIAYETIDRAVAMVDRALIESGFSVIDEKA